MFMLNKSQRKASSRKQIQIKEVKDNILVLPNNTYRVVLETSSINFELKSEAEQDVLIDSFQNFLNSLPCQLQILIRVREVDIDQYVEHIVRTKQKELESVYKDQITHYCHFIQNLVTGNKILSRRFYIVIPYSTLDRKQDFSFIKEQMNLIRDIVLRGLERLGMKARPLNNLEILNLFYGLYNSDQLKTQPLDSSTIEALLRSTNV